MMKRSMYGEFIAGGLITLADFVLLSVDKPIGPFLFAFALFLICANGYPLYTGKVGFISESKNKTREANKILSRDLSLLLANEVCLY